MISWRKSKRSVISWRMSILPVASQGFCDMIIDRNSKLYFHLNCFLFQCEFCRDHLMLMYRRSHWTSSVQFKLYTNKWEETLWSVRLRAECVQCRVIPLRLEAEVSVGSSRDVLQVETEKWRTIRDQVRMKHNIKRKKKISHSYPHLCLFVELCVA